jgi:hypothetical protein
LSTSNFVLDWHGGSSAVLDLQAVEERNAEDGESWYSFRYSSPFRPTMRAPAQEMRTGAETLDRIVRELDDFAAQVGRTRAGEEGEAEAPPSLDRLKSLGQNTSTLVLPGYVSSELRDRGMFVEIGTDEALLHFPWELMHDNDDFLCLKHYVGRFINVRQPLEQSGKSPYPPRGELGDLRFLLVGVPSPRGDSFSNLPRLEAVEAEIEAIVETLADADVSPRLLLETDATWNKLMKTLREERFHIIHFAGHARFDARAPRRSAIILDDDAFFVGSLTAALGDQRPVLCVVNACETARTGGAPEGPRPETLSWSDQYNVYGLARAFLETGAYFLGSRWRLADKSARIFASTFYAALLNDGVPIGRAITEARRTAQSEADPRDYSWASYVYYGHPRVRFSKLDPTKPTSTPLVGLADQLGRQATAAATSELPDDIDHSAFDGLAHEYEVIRATIPSGPERTARMSEIVRRVHSLGGAADHSAIVDEFADGTAGERIVALGLVQANPMREHFEYIQDAILHSQSGFEQYHALRAADLMVPILSAEQKATLMSELAQLLDDEEFFGTDRSLLADQILRRAGTSPAVAGGVLDSRPA